jgi:hypothetical protein
MLYAVVIVGALAGSLLVFWVAAVPVWLVLGAAKWALGKAGVPFDDDKDDDPNSLRLIAVAIGLSAGLGIALAVAGGGWLVLHRTPWAAAVTASLVGGIVSARLTRHGFAGMSALPALVAAGVAGAALGCVAAFGGCDRKPEIVKALPPSVTDAVVSRKDAPGSPEGDATLVVTARFPDAPSCRAFISGYAPREKLAPAAGGWSRDDPGRESRSLRCDDAQMRYEDILY